MRIHIHHHYPHNDYEEKINELLRLAKSNNLILKKIMGTQEQLAEQLRTLTGQTQKIKTEVEKLLQVIEDQKEVSPELQAAADGLQAAIAGVDDLNADAPEPEA